MDYAMQFGLNRQVNAYPWRLVAQATQQSWHIEPKQISICGHRKALTILVVGMLKSGYAQRKVQHKIAIQPSNKTEVDLWKFHGGRDRACWAESLQFVAKRFQSHGNQQRWAARPTTLAMRLIMLCIQFQAFVSHCQDTRNRTPLNRKQAHSCKGVCRLGWIKGTEINGAAVQQLGAQTSNFKSLSPRAAVAAFCHLPLRQLGELQLAEVNQSTMSEDSIGPVFKEDVLAITAVDAEDDACDSQKVKRSRIETVKRQCHHQNTQKIGTVVVATCITPSWSSKVKSLLLGQLISVLNTFTGVFSATLQQSGINLPTTQSTLHLA